MQNTLSPKELARAIGVSESSLKRWVDEGTVNAIRTFGGHRRIPRNDALAFVRQQGYPLLRPDLLGLAEAEAGAEAGGAIDGVFHAALQEGRAAEAQRLVIQRFVAGDSVARLVDEVMAPAMRALGELWQYDQAGIYIEHRAVDICTQILDRLRALLPDPAPEAPVAVGGAHATDPYTLPSLMAATVIAAEGWRTLNLGAFVPPGVLTRAVVDQQARLAWLALGAVEGRRGVDNEVETTLTALAQAGEPPILVAGGPACHCSGHRPPEPARFAESMPELAGLVRGLPV
ncbi:excisionase family DNA-binding protein [Thiohalorhabdus sp.]|uniref:excisionase family DNA-binding protein n=1 Tax=Thiohalorhabdus sp. TaxID=3094134 RepID=UPI002FC27C94